MFMTRRLLRRHPNYEDFMTPFWELEGPRGPSKIKRMNRTRRIDIPVTEEHKADMQAKLQNEFNVMRCLASPFLSKEQEEVWHQNHGHPVDLHKKAIEEFEETRMPGRQKAWRGKKSDKIRANVGNLLHKHRTVEDHLGYLFEQRRFDG